jgi:hypothetical protein
MAELGSGMPMDEGFDLMPIAFVVAYLFAVRADG